MEHYPLSVHLTVADIKKSIKFYTEKLGFTLENTYPNPKKPVHACLVLDRQSIMLGVSMTADDAKKAGMSKDEIDLVRKDAKAFGKAAHGVGASFFLCVPDVDAHYKVAKKKKVDILASPKTQFYGLREYVAEDLDGYRFVFYTQVMQEAPSPSSPSAANGPGDKEEEAVADA
ncbi:MAG: VOC family protein [Planctomycetota bacterium]